jgi:hypothetical protein
LHTNNTQNDKKQTIHRTTQQLEECGQCLFFADYILAFALQLRKKQGKTSVKVVVPLNLLCVELQVMRRIKKFWNLLAQSLNIYRVEIVKSHTLVYLKTLMRCKYIMMGE